MASLTMLDSEACDIRSRPAEGCHQMAEIIVLLHLGHMTPQETKATTDPTTMFAITRQKTNSQQLDGDDE